ncbi:MAG: triose-phosphate isomerase [Nanobdellota archaeon]
MAKIDIPAIVVNFKTYEQSIGNKAIELAKTCEKVQKDTGTEIIICINNIDLKEVNSETSIPLFSQHTDGYDYGSSTGKIIPSELKRIGVDGTLLNHSEDRYSFEELQKAIDKCKENGIYTLACAKDCEEVKKIASMKPDAIAIEPPGLIGGDISVTTANPDIVTECVEVVKKIDSEIKVFCGAGVKSGDDIAKAIELGTSGVLLASGITKAEDPEKILKEMCDKLNLAKPKIIEEI